MASLQRLSLERSMDQFRSELTDDQMKEISSANRKAITHEIEKLQAKIGNQQGLCRLSGIKRFLDTMEEIEKLVTIFLNVSEVVAFIWGPIKLVLMVATTWKDSVKKIIDVYDGVAVALDNLAVFHNLIRSNEQLKCMLEDYFSDILRFHRFILAVFCKPGWKRMFEFAWREFKRNVEPIIESLKRKQAMLSDDKLQQHAILKTIQDSDSHAKGQFEQINSGMSEVLKSERLRRQEQDKKQIKSTRAMLCHIITQIINADETTMRFAYDKCSSMDYLDISSLKSLALDCLLAQRDTLIILDGLDEAKDNEPENALKWLSSDDVQDLVIKVSNAAEVITPGMFLYARVVLANLASMGSKKEFKAELEGNKFPRDLNQAYERIVERVIHAAGPSAQTSAKKILGWLVCSERPLRWREIQSRFCIDVERGFCDPDDVRVGSCKQLCSSLVDATDCEIFPGVKSEQTIAIIHETASKYLVYTKTIDVMKEHMAMSLFCCQYLVSKPFHDIDNDNLKESARSGYFGFIDYAAVYWRSHLQKVGSIKEHSDLCLMSDKARDALSNLEDTYYRNVVDSAAEPDSAVQHSKESSKALSRAIQNKVLQIRAIIDGHREILWQDTGFQDLQGPKRFSCPRISCYKFFAGYPSEARRQQHLASHTRPFRCRDEDCFAYVVGYTNTPTPMGFVTACKAGDLKQVKLLHNIGASFNGPALLAAVEAGHGRICKYLIDNGVSPFEMGTSGYELTPMHRAIRNRNFHTLELFLLGYQKLTSSLNASLLQMCVREILEIYPPGVDILLRLLAERQPKRGPSVLESIMASQLAILFRIWGKRMTVFANDERVFDHSKDATLIHTHFRQIFPNLYDSNGVFASNANGQEYKIYQQTIRKHKRLLHDALAINLYSLAMFLMDIDTNRVMQTEGRGGNSPLHSFIMRSCELECNGGCSTIAECLIKLDRGGLSHQPNDNGHLPIHIALDRELSPVVLRPLLEFSKDLNHKDNWGMSPLHYVRDEEAMDMVLQYKDVDLFSRNQDGQTCFVMFCKIDEAFNEDLMLTLMARDMSLAWTADKSSEGLTPLHHAMSGYSWVSDAEYGRWSDDGSPNATTMLLKLPVAEQILQAYSTCPVGRCEEVRHFCGGDVFEAYITSNGQDGVWAGCHT
ncbi:unnamed protein product [Fusarium langsethiae]|nr:unnamed protein product [Fusarium langsethiae]